MNVFSYLRKALAAAILLVLLCPGALAVGGDFNAELDIQRTKDRILVTVVDSDVLAQEQPTLIISCEFPYAQLTFDGKRVDSLLAERRISFTVVAGGTYTITKLDAPPDEPDEPDKPDEPEDQDAPDATDQPEEGNESVPQEPGDQEIASIPFSDVKEGAWYYTAVAYVWETGIMTGVADGIFAPDSPVNRAMAWTILARMADADTEGGETWYAAAQAWTIAAGISDGTDAMGTITREELITMLYRAAGSPATQGVMPAFPDSDRIAIWAQEAMIWATNHGILRGDENGCILPQGVVSRRETAVILMRYDEAIHRP